MPSTSLPRQDSYKRAHRSPSAQRWPSISNRHCRQAQEKGNPQVDNDTEGLPFLLLSPGRVQYEASLFQEPFGPASLRLSTARGTRQRRLICYTIPISSQVTPAPKPPAQPSRGIPIIRRAPTQERLPPEKIIGAALSHHFDSLHRTVGHDGTYHIDTASQRRNIEAVCAALQQQ